MTCSSPCLSEPLHKRCSERDCGIVMSFNLSVWFPQLLQIQFPELPLFRQLREMMLLLYSLLPLPSWKHRRSLLCFPFQPTALRWLINYASFCLPQAFPSQETLWLACCPAGDADQLSMVSSPEERMKAIA